MHVLLSGMASIHQKARLEAEHQDSISGGENADQINTEKNKDDVTNASDGQVINHAFILDQFGPQVSVLSKYTLITWCRIIMYRKRQSTIAQYNDHS